MKATAELGLKCSDMRVLKSLVSVLAPDNEGGPRGLRIDTVAHGRTLNITIAAGSAATAFSTALAFLRDVSLFQEVWLLSQPKPG